MLWLGAGLIGAFVLQSAAFTGCSSTGLSAGTRAFLCAAATPGDRLMNSGELRRARFLANHAMALDELDRRAEAFALLDEGWALAIQDDGWVSRSPRVVSFSAPFAMLRHLREHRDPLLRAWFEERPAVVKTFLAGAENAWTPDLSAPSPTHDHIHPKMPGPF